MTRSPPSRGSGPPAARHQRADLAGSAGQAATWQKVRRDGGRLATASRRGVEGPGQVFDATHRPHHTEEPSAGTSAFR